MLPRACVCHIVFMSVHLTVSLGGRIRLEKQDLADKCARTASSAAALDMDGAKDLSQGGSSHEAVSHVMQQLSDDELVAGQGIYMQEKGELR